MFNNLFRIDYFYRPIQTKHPKKKFRLLCQIIMNNLHRYYVQLPNIIFVTLQYYGILFLYRLGKFINFSKYMQTPIFFYVNFFASQISF